MESAPPVRDLRLVLLQSLGLVEAQFCLSTEVSLTVPAVVRGLGGGHGYGVA